MATFDYIPDVAQLLSAKHARPGLLGAVQQENP